jgi:hypothetical protein
MSKKQSVFFWMIAILSLGGCATIQYQANLDAHPFYITEQRGDPPVKAVVFSKTDIDYKALDERIAGYLSKHPETPEKIAKNMKDYVIANGMNKEQVLTITGKNPDSKDFNKENEERWVFGSVIAQGRAVIITFEGDYVVNITDKYWDSCPQC